VNRDLRIWATPLRPVPREFALLAGILSGSQVNGEMVHRASRKPPSIAIFSNARWRGKFREGVNRDGARLFQHSMSATAQMAPHCTTVRRTPKTETAPIA
jgi:hypothetical protein